MQIEQQNYLNTPSLSDVDETYLRVCMPFSKFRLHKINSLDQLSLVDSLFCRDLMTEIILACLQPCLSLQVVWNFGPRVELSKGGFQTGLYFLPCNTLSM